LERQQIQNEVEARLNVDIVYRAYPANAPWGPDRVTAIIQSSVAGDHLADIYWSVSDWIQSLVKGDAIVPIDQYLSTTGQNIHESFLEIGSYQEQTYGFGADKLTVDVGLYYNADLVASLGVDNPTDLFLDGLWTWSKFDQWATQVQTALSAQADDMFALGGMLSSYAESMIPLNGGSLINATTKRVAFAQNPALETYAFLNSLYTKGLFELAPQYDAGSPLWQAGKVAMHPGNLWFVNADNRWGGLAFELGFVPYPRSNTFVGDYISPVSGVAVYHVATGMTPERQALVFQVWNELQIWRTEAEMADSFELSLMTKFDQEEYVEAYLAIYDKVYLDLINAIGIGAYSENGWRRNVNLAIREGTARTVMDQIKPIYEAALEAYLNG
jgi:maltose-binding protein MalE